MSKVLKINLTLSKTNSLDIEIISHLLCFSSGTGISERSTEIKRLLRKGILEEKSTQASGHSAYSGRTIRPAIFSDEVSQERQAFLKTPTLSAPEVTEVDGVTTPLIQQVSVTGNDRANEVVPPNKAVSVAPPTKVVDKATAMLGHLMDDLAAEEQKTILGK